MTSPGEGAGLVVTPLLDGNADTWRRMVDDAHAKQALVVARLATTGGALETAVDRAAAAGFDLLLLDPGVDEVAIEHLPAMVAAARRRWRDGGWIAAAVHDRPHARAAVVGHVAQLVRAGANLVWVTSSGDQTMAGARLPAAPIADRLRNELGVATAVDGGRAQLADLDAAIAAGRADLVVVDRLPSR